MFGTPILCVVVEIGHDAAWYYFTLLADCLELVDEGRVGDKYLIRYNITSYAYAEAEY